MSEKLCSSYSLLVTQQMALNTAIPVSFCHRCYGEAIRRCESELPNTSLLQLWTKHSSIVANSSKTEHESKSEFIWAADSITSFPSITFSSLQPSPWCYCVISPHQHPIDAPEEQIFYLIHSLGWVNIQHYLSSHFNGIILSVLHHSFQTNDSKQTVTLKNS